MLAELVALRDAGLREPLPMAPKTSRALRRRAAAQTARQAATRPDAGRATTASRRRAHVLVWGRDRRSTTWPRRDRVGRGRGGESTRFGALALRLWTPLARRRRGARSTTGDGDDGGDAYTATVPAFDLLGPLPPAPRCSRPAPGPARRSPSPRWSPATSPRGGAARRAAVVTFGRAATQELRDRVRERLVAGARRRWPTRRGPTPTTPLIDAAAGDDDAERPGARRLARRARGLRRGHDRDHPRVLPAGAGRPRHGRRRRRRRAVRREPRRPHRRGRRRPLPAHVEPPDAAPAAVDRRRRALALGRTAVGDRQAVLVPDGRRGRRRGRTLRAPVRRGRARRGRAAQARAPPAQLRRPADPAAGDARRPAAGAAARPAAAGALPGRAGRRVPGHRPGAVGHPAAGLPRAHDAGADRRPEAGDLRLPRRATCTPTSPRPTQRRPPGHAGPQLAQRRRPARRPRGACSGGAALGDPRIVVQPVRGRAPRPGLAGAPRAAPVQLRVVPRGAAAATGGRPRPRSVTADVVRRGRRPARRRSAPAAPRTTCGGAAGRPRRHRRARAHQRASSTSSATALLAAGVPAVLRGAVERVRAPPPRADWLVAARGAGAAAPGRRACGAAALTAFLGLGRRRARRRPRRRSTELGAAAAALGRGVRRPRGRGAVRDRHAATSDLPARLLAPADGERRLTDLRHVGEALHAAAMAARLGLAALAGVAAPRGSRRGRRGTPPPNAAGGWTPTPPPCRSSPCTPARAWSSRRLRAVRVGPVRPRARESRCSTTPPAAGCATSAAGSARTAPTSQPPHNAEEFGEDLRLLYVALTRAQSPGRRRGGRRARRHASARRCTGCCSAGSPAAGDARRASRCRRRRARRCGRARRAAVDGARRSSRRRAASGAAPVAGPAPPSTAGWPSPASTASSTPLAAHVLQRAHRRAPTTRRPGCPAQRARGRRRRTTSTETPTPEVDAGTRHCAPSRSPMADLPGGAAFGTLVHAVLETVDTAAADLAAELRAPRPSELARGPARRGDRPTALADGAAAGRCARRSARWPAAGRWPTSRPRDRLAELDFELPLARRRPRRPAPSGHPAVELAALLRAPPARRRPAGRLRRPARRPGRRRRRCCAATSPAASTPCCACDGRLRRRRLQDQPARRARSTSR